MSNQEIKEALPFGAITEISNKANVHYHTVRRVLSGTSNNLKVKAAIAKYLKNKKKEENKIERDLKSALM